MNEISRVEFDVSGMRFTLLKADIDKYPDSFLAGATKKEWRKNGGPIQIERDGMLFRSIFAFIVSGQLPAEMFENKNKDLLKAVAKEADFYGIPVFQAEHLGTDVGSALKSYATIRKYLAGAKGRLASEEEAYAEVEVDHPMESCTLLLDSLAHLWAPFCIRGVYDKSKTSILNRKAPLFKKTTLHNVDVDELLAEAAPSAFGRGTETVLDPEVRHSLEIPASQLDKQTLKRLGEDFELGALCPTMLVKLKPYKLVIYQEGGHFDQHRDTVRGEGHIGTLVLILNSAYTGGELEITHGGRTEVVTGPYHWVAMYGDCLHKINPVTSGTRVSLIYDIYAEDHRALAHAEQEEEEEDGKDATSSGDDGSADASPDVKRAKIETCASDDSGSKSSDYSMAGEENWLAERRELMTRESFWEPQNRWQQGAVVPEQATPHRLDKDMVCAVIKGLNKELKKFPTVVICLQHMYPACQAVPGFLKGGDAVLYDLLTKDHPGHQARYEVQVVYCSIYREFTDDNDVEKLTAELFTSFERHDSNASLNPSSQGARAKVKTRKSKATKLVIPIPLNADSVLDYTPWSGYTGNEEQMGETVYVVAGLQVRRRE